MIPYGKQDNMENRTTGQYVLSKEREYFVLFVSISNPPEDISFLENEAKIKKNRTKTGQNRTTGQKQDTCLEKGAKKGYFPVFCPARMYRVVVQIAHFLLVRVRGTNKLPCAKSTGH